MTSLFDKELIEMEREVRDLKTIHQRGLGTTRFYTYEQVIQIPNGYYVWYLFGTFEDANLAPAVVMPFVGGPTISNFTIEFIDDGFGISTLATEGTVTVYIVSSAPIASFRVEIEEW